MKRLIVYLAVLLFLFSDSLLAQVEGGNMQRVTREFGLSGDFSEIIRLELDTLIDGFQRYKVIEETTPFYINLGNYGLPLVEIDFFERNWQPDDWLFRYYKPYMHHTGNVRFVDTQVPFSELIFTFGGPRAVSEQTFSVRHSQNVNRYLNFGLDLDVIYNLGQYNYQKTDDRSFTFHSSYTGRKYEFLGAWNLNNISGYNNGGIEEMGTLTQNETRNIAVNLGELNKSSTTFKNRSLLLVQRYTVERGKANQPDSTMKQRSGTGLSGVLSHIVKWETNRGIHSDNSPFIGFYDTAYISNILTNNVPTYDSLYSRKLTNTIRFDFRTRETAKVQVGIGAGIINELDLYSQVVPTFDTLFSDTLKWRTNSSAVVGKVFNRIGEKFGWEATGKLYFSGYRSGDLDLNGKITKFFGSGEKRSEISAWGAFSNRGAAWWLNNWGSNNFVWNNNFRKEQRLNIGGGFKHPSYLFDVSLDYSLITNHIYFNNSAIPDQYENPLSVITARIYKNFRFWKLNFENYVILQQSGNSDIIDLPLLSIRTTFYFNHLFQFRSTGGKLGFQLGVESSYISPFWSYNYMPATNVFFNQNITRSGNYPYLSVFANLKLKRTRMFFSFEHLNSGLMGDEYYIVPKYPMPVRTFKYGISWTFYN